MADESQGKPAIPVFFFFFFFFFFFASYAIDVHVNEFQPTNKAAFICTTRPTQIMYHLNSGL